MTHPLLKETLTELDQILAPLGFTKRAKSFYRDNGSEQLILEMESNRYSDAAHLLMRCWVCLTNETLARFKGDRALVRRPKWGEVPMDLGSFLPKAFGAQWVVELQRDPLWKEGASEVGRGTPREVAGMVSAVVVEQVLPAAALLTSDVAICDYMLSGGGSFRRGFGAGLNIVRMAILTGKHGPPEAFERYAELVATHLGEESAPTIARLRAGDFYAPGFAPGEKGKPTK